MRATDATIKSGSYALSIGSFGGESKHNDMFSKK